MKTIDAMKQARDLFHGIYQHDDQHAFDARKGEEILNDAISREEAQTVEPLTVDLPDCVVDQIKSSVGFLCDMEQPFYDFAQALKFEVIARIPSTHPAPAIEPTQVSCQLYGHVVGACVECNTHSEPAKLPENCGTGYCSCVECVKPAKSSTYLAGFDKTKYTPEQWSWCKNYDARTGFDPMMGDFESGTQEFFEAARSSIDWFEMHSSDAMHSIGINIPGDPINEN